MSSRVKHTTVCDSGTPQRPPDKWKERKARGAARNPLGGEMQRLTQSFFRSLMKNDVITPRFMPSKRGRDV